MVILNFIITEFGKDLGTQIWVAMVSLSELFTGVCAVQLKIQWQIQ